MAINRLIKKIASRPSTEELILFIADDDEMTRACVELQKILDSSTGQDRAELAARCRSYQISLDTLSQEIQRLLAIFAPETINNEYAVLGLVPDADHEQVKKAFRRLSIKYHPDSSGGGDSDKFIELCQAYKTILSRSGSETAATTAEAPSWRYRKKQGLTPQQKRKNIYLFAALATILFIISIIAPYSYRNNAMREHLNTIDPILVSQPETDQQPPSDNDNVEAWSPAASLPVPDKPEDTPEIPKPDSTAASQPAVQEVQEVPLQLEEPVAADVIIEQQPARQAPTVVNAPPTEPDLDRINRFIDSYTTTYESRDFKRFSRFFAPDALENGDPFSDHQEKYLSLFQAADTISLDIAMLSSTVKDQYIELRGRFRLHLSYPQAQPYQAQGKIVLLLTENNHQYLVKELNYSFDTTE